LLLYVFLLQYTIIGDWPSMGNLELTSTLLVGL
jgi:hypothetical protein